MEEVKNRFLQFSEIYSKGMYLRPAMPIEDCSLAAVLVGLFRKEDSLHVILTQRTYTVTSHKGQVALPGGKKDPEDINLITTALREANEEIGLPLCNVDVIAQLFPIPTSHNVLVHPVVSFVDNNFDIKLNQDEVESLFTVPLATFLSDDNHCIQNIEYHNQMFTVHSFNYYDDVNSRQYRIWGLTAAILIQASVTAFDREPDYVNKPGLIKHWYTLPSVICSNKL